MPDRWDRANQSEPEPWDDAEEHDRDARRREEWAGDFDDMPESERPLEADVSRFGGQADLADSDEWGVCQECGEPIPLIMEICRHCGAFQVGDHHLEATRGEKIRWTVWAVAAVLTALGVALLSGFGSLLGW